MFVFQCTIQILPFPESCCPPLSEVTMANLSLHLDSSPPSLSLQICSVVLFFSKFGVDSESSGKVSSNTRKKFALRFVCASRRRGSLGRTHVFLSRGLKEIKIIFLEMPKICFFSDPRRSQDQEEEYIN